MNMSQCGSSASIWNLTSLLYKYCLHEPICRLPSLLFSIVVHVIMEECISSKPIAYDGKYISVSFPLVQRAFETFYYYKLYVVFVKFCLQQTNVPCLFNICESQICCNHITQNLLFTQCTQIAFPYSSFFYLLFMS